MIRSLVSALALFAAAPAFAGHENGNGGDLVICDKIELLDYYEGRTRGLMFDVARPPMPEVGHMPFEALRWHYVAQFLARVEKFDAPWAETLSGQLRGFFDEALIVDLVLTDVADSLHLGLPQGCRIEQAAVQRAPLFPEDKRYVIAKKWWPRSPLFNCDYERGTCDIPWNATTQDEAQDIRAKSALQAAGLMIHEVIFRRALAVGQTNSIRTRYFHAYVMSQKYHALTPESWRQLKSISEL